MFWCFKSVIGWCRIKTHYRLLWAVIGRYSSQTHCTTHVVPYDAQIEQIQFGLFKNTPRVQILLQSSAFWTPHHRWKPFASGTVGPVSSTTLSAVSLFFWSNQAYSKCGWDDKSSGTKYTGFKCQRDKARSKGANRRKPPSDVKWFSYLSIWSGWAVVRAGCPPGRVRQQQAQLSPKHHRLGPRGQTQPFNAHCRQPAPPNQTTACTNNTIFSIRSLYINMPWNRFFKVIVLLIFAKPKPSQ